MNRRVISKEHNLSSSENNTQKKNQACTKFEPMARRVWFQLFNDRGHPQEFLESVLSKFFEWFSLLIYFKKLIWVSWVIRCCFFMGDVVGFGLYLTLNWYFSLLIQSSLTLESSIFFKSDLCLCFFAEWE